MESARLISRCYEFLRKINKLRSEGYLPIYIYETWYDTHNTIKKMWSDGSAKCQVSKFASKGRRVVIYHARCRTDLYQIHYFYVENLSLKAGETGQHCLPNTIVCFCVISYGQSTHVAITTRTMMFG